MNYHKPRNDFLSEKFDFLNVRELVNFLFLLHQSLEKRSASTLKDELAWICCEGIKTYFHGFLPVASAQDVATLQN